MITALQLIFTPFRTWERINAAQRSVLWILCLFLLPFLVSTVGLEGLSLWHWGERQDQLDHMVKISSDLAIRYSVAQLVLLLVSIFLGAKFLQWITFSFQVQSSYKRCFTMMAYGFGPIMLLRLFDALPRLNTWVCWGIGVLLSISALYHGVGLILRPEQTKGFGLYLVSMLTLVLSSGLSHFVAVSVLHGKIFHGI